VEETLLPLLPASWHREIQYFTEDEFNSKIMVDGLTKIVPSGEIQEKYNNDTFIPLDGEIVKACDEFAAYMETYLSISHGIKSHALTEAHKHLYEKYEGKKVAGFDFGGLFDYFRA
jgi:putative hydrolase of HD superfamily